LGPEYPENQVDAIQNGKDSGPKAELNREIRIHTYP
jgi:hypothetical protein